jgi:hypothetical protein
MGMSIGTFLELTPSQWQAAYDAWLEMRTADAKNDMLRRMHAARWMVSKMLAPPFKPGESFTIFDLIELDGDKEMLEEIRKKTPQSTKERFEELKERWR